MSILKKTSGKRAVFQVESTTVDGRDVLEIWWGQLSKDAPTDMKLIGLAPNTPDMRRLINNRLERDAKNDLWLEPTMRDF